MAKYNKPEIQVKPYHSSILEIRAHICRTIWIFSITDIQSLSIVVRICPWYQKDITISRGSTYALRSDYGPACVYYSISLSDFHSAPLLQR